MSNKYQLFEQPPIPQRTVFQRLFGDKILDLYFAVTIAGMIAMTILIWKDSEGYQTGYREGYAKAAEVYGWAIPSVRQLQERLVDAGFELTVDGKLGQATRQAWDKSYINQVARSWVDGNVPGVEVWTRRQNEGKPLLGNSIPPAIEP